MKNSKVSRLISLAIISVFSFWIASCHKQNFESSGSIELSKNAITLDSTSGSKDSITVYSPVAWQAVIAPGIDWLQIDKISGGPGNTVVRLTFRSTNQPTTPGSATISFKAINGNTTQPANLTVTLRSYSFSLDFYKAFGGTNYDAPGRSAIAKTADGGMVIAGVTNSHDGDLSNGHGGDDAWVLKLDRTGAVTWSKILGGSGEDAASSVTATSDGGFEIAGYSNSHDGDVPRPHGGSDVWVVKLDADGNIIWSKTYGGSANEAGRAIVSTADGGSAVVGFAGSEDGDVHGSHGGADVWVLRLNAQGDTLWTGTFGGSDWDEGSHIITTPDGGFALTGLTFSNDGDVIGYHTPTFIGADAWVVKLNSNGRKLWAKTLGGTGDDVGQSIVAANGGGYLLTAYATSADGDISDHHGNGLFNDIWVVRLDDDGNKIWSRTYGGRLDDAPTSLITVSDGGYLLVGGTDSHDGDLAGDQAADYNMFILKLDRNGDVQWSKKYGGTNDDAFFSVAVDNEGAFWLVGSTNSNDGDILNSGYHGDYDLWIARLFIQ